LIGSQQFLVRRPIRNVDNLLLIQTGKARQKANRQKSKPVTSRIVVERVRKLRDMCVHDAVENVTAAAFIE